jgi:peptide/nickel transport system substrate-binding protein
MPEDSQAVALVANQWRKLNIQVNVNILPSQQLNDNVIKPRAFDVLLFPQKFGADPDPFLFWHSSQVKDPGFNLTGFSNPEADQLIVSARTTTDKQQRTTDYDQLSQLILSSNAAIFLNQTEYIYITDQSLHNIGINFLYDPSQRFYDAANWYMQTKRVWK